MNYNVKLEWIYGENNVFNMTNKLFKIHNIVGPLSDSVWIVRMIGIEIYISPIVIYFIDEACCVRFVVSGLTTLVVPRSGSYLEEPFDVSCRPASQCIHRCKSYLVVVRMIRVWEKEEPRDIARFYETTLRSRHH